LQCIYSSKCLKQLTLHQNISCSSLTKCPVSYWDVLIVFFSLLCLTVGNYLYIWFITWNSHIFSQGLAEKTHHFTLLDGEMVIDTLPDTQKQERRYLIYDMMALNHVSVIEVGFFDMKPPSFPSWKIYVSYTLRGLLVLFEYYLYIVVAHSLFYDFSDPFMNGGEWLTKKWLVQGIMNVNIYTRVETLTIDMSWSLSGYVSSKWNILS